MPPENDSRTEYRVKEIKKDGWTVAANIINAFFGSFNEFDGNPMPQTRAGAGAAVGILGVGAVANSIITHGDILVSFSGNVIEISANYSRRGGPARGFAEIESVIPNVHFQKEFAWFKRSPHGYITDQFTIAVGEVKFRLPGRSIGDLRITVRLSNAAGHGTTYFITLTPAHPPTLYFEQGR